MRKSIAAAALLLAGVTLAPTGASAQYYGGYGGYGGPRYRAAERWKAQNYAAAQAWKNRNYAASQYYKDRAYNQALRWKYSRPYGYGGYYGY